MSERTKGINLLNTVRKRGADFDKGVKEGLSEPDTLDQLIKLGGLFQLKDIIDRLPFNEYTVRNWAYQESSQFKPCFHLVAVGVKRSMKLLDLTMFNKILQETLNEPASEGPKKKATSKKGQAKPKTTGEKPTVRRKKQ